MKFSCGFRLSNMEDCFEFTFNLNRQLLATDFRKDLGRKNFAQDSSKILFCLFFDVDDNANSFLMSSMMRQRPYDPLFPFELRCLLM